MSLQDLVNVVRSGDVKKVESFLTQHPNFDLNQLENSKSDDTNLEFTPLMIACTCDSINLEMVKLLLAKGADPNFKNILGPFINYTVLAFAVDCKIKDLAKLLVENGAHVAYTEGSDLDKCALAKACRQGDLDMVKILLPHGATIDPTWAFPLCSVSLQHNIEISYIYSPVNIALSEGHVEVVEWLLENGAEVPSGALHIAIHDYHDCRKIPNTNHMIKILLDHGAQVNPSSTDEPSPLMLASYHGEIEMVKMLLERGAQVNYILDEEYVALSLAARQGQADVVKLLLDKGAQVDLAGNRGGTSLRTVIESRDLSETKRNKVVKVLIEGGANANFQNESYLLTAVGRNQVEIAQLLLDHGADIHYQTKSSEYALGVAIRHNYTKLIHLLLERGARTDVLDHDGNTLLMFTQDFEIVQLLLDRGVPVNQQDCDGMYPLLQALKNGNVCLAELLLENGADSSLTTDDGTSALSYVQSKLNMYSIVVSC